MGLLGNVTVWICIIIGGTARSSMEEAWAASRRAGGTEFLCGDKLYPKSICITTSVHYQSFNLFFVAGQ